jgi:hypothetical protein
VAGVTAIAFELLKLLDAMLLEELVKLSVVVPYSGNDSWI